MIEIKNATKKYKEQTVLNNVSVDFARGGIHGLIGRNGSGKTMLLKAVTGLIKLDEGYVKVRGKTVGKDFDFPPDMGVLIEKPGFLPQYNSFKNLKMLAAINDKISDEEIRKTIKKVGLDPYDKKHVGKYSLGMKQRLGIAQAIMEDPELLLLDEPLSGLDVYGIREMRALFKELKKAGKTIVIATHNREDVAELCDSIHQMNLGKIYEASDFESYFK